MAAEGIPIVVHERGPFVRFPASAEDVRAVLARLPVGVATGLALVELALDEVYAPTCAGPVDPFVGRLRVSLAAGVFAQRRLGVYRCATSTIRLAPYVYDPARPDRAILDLYLRLRMLETFVHEMAHHHDVSQRGGRRQWRAHDEEHLEAYARRMQRVWTGQAVLPYLREAYAREVDALERWVAFNGGVELRLEDLACDRSQLFGIADAFEYLIARVAQGAPRELTRRDFNADLTAFGWSGREEPTAALR